MTAIPQMTTIQNIILKIQFVQLAQAILLIIAGFIIAHLIKLAVGKFSLKRFPHAKVAIFQKIISYFILSLFFIAALQQLGFTLNVFLGAAGILTLAFAFAAQLIVSNLISGLFLIAERPFRIGECIAIDSINGEVIAIDALSIKIKTAENTMVRIPNETLIKANITNLSRFPIRRFDLTIGLSYEADSDQVQSIFLKVAENNAYCLKEPAPKVNLASFGEFSVNWQLLCYTEYKNLSSLKSSLQQEIKKAFELNKIEMPFPTHSIYINTDANPLAIKIIES